MTAAKLGFLSVLAIQFRPDVIQQLQVAEVRPLGQSFDKGPAQGTLCLPVLESVGSVHAGSVSFTPKGFFSFFFSLCCGEVAPYEV